MSEPSKTKAVKPPKPPKHRRAVRQIRKTARKLAKRIRRDCVRTGMIDPPPMLILQSGGNAVFHALQELGLIPIEPQPTLAQQPSQPASAPPEQQQSIVRNGQDLTINGFARINVEDPEASLFECVTTMFTPAFEHVIRSQPDDEKASAAAAGMLHAMLRASAALIWPIAKKHMTEDALRERLHEALANAIERTRADQTPPAGASVVHTLRR